MPPAPEEGARADADMPLYERKLDVIPVESSAAHNVWTHTATNCLYAHIFYYLSACLVLAFWVAVEVSIPGPKSFSIQFCVAALMLDYFRMPAGQDILHSVYVGLPGLLGAFKCGMVLIIVWGCISFQIFQAHVHTLHL